MVKTSSPKTKTKRPDLERITNSATFLTWYWLKAELTDFCKARGLSTSGLKADLTARIAYYLDTGDKPGPEDMHAKRPTSKVVWSKLDITPETVITDSYTNGPNVRAFFESEIGKRFRFNIAFMDWMRENAGKTMGEAVKAWLAIEARRKNGETAPIPQGNQYNQYVRDFFAANPGRTMDEARTCWKAKRNSPGHNRYEKKDLTTLKI